MASKKSTYHHYPIFTDRVVKVQRRAARLSKKQSSGILTQFLNTPDYVHSLDALVMAMEHQLLSRGGQFIIPDAELSERLTNIKLSTVTGDAWSWPYEFSTISIPTGQRFADQQCQGIFVAWTQREEMELRYVPEFLKAHGSRLDVVSAGSRGQLLEIVVPGEMDRRFPGGFPTVLRVSLTPADITKFINDNALLGPSAKGFMMAEMSEDEANFMKEVLRYVLSLGMYISAFPDALTPGVPSFMANKHPGGRKGHRPKFVSLGQGSDASLREALQAPRKVIGHWRQLRHEKYYQGQYKEMPRGTRYVLVSEYATGSNRTTGVEAPRETQIAEVIKEENE